MQSLAFCLFFHLLPYWLDPQNVSPGMAAIKVLLPTSDSNLWKQNRSRPLISICHFMPSDDKVLLSCSLSLFYLFETLRLEELSLAAPLADRWTWQCLILSPPENAVTGINEMRLKWPLMGTQMEYYCSRKEWSMSRFESPPFPCSTKETLESRYMSPALLSNNLTCLFCSLL